MNVGGLAAVLTRAAADARRAAWHRRPWVPLAVSVAGHAVVFALIFARLGAWEAPVDPGPPGEGGVIVNLAPMKAPVAATQAVIASTPPSVAAESVAAESVPRRADAERRGDASAAGGGSGLAGAAAVVVPGSAAAAAPRANPGGAALAGALAASDASAVGVAFAGLTATPTRSVVYVLDASGPMVTALPQVLALVSRSVRDLRPTQQFGVVLFREAPGEAGVEVFAPRLLDATARNRGRLHDWLAGVRPRGRSNPLAGLRAGLALRPQVIFLLTRSIERSEGGQWERGLDALLADLETLNPVDPATGRRRTVIKTIQFLSDDPTGIMAAIAEKHGRAATSDGANAADEPAYRVLRQEELPE